jgi:RNA polymerase sigma factor (sigma-70 family)
MTRGTGLDDKTRVRRFEEICMTHMHAAHNLARWLARDDRDAEDVLQEACLRAYKFLESFDGSDGRVWLLAIVRNTYYTWLDKHRVHKSSVEFDEEILAAQGYDVHTLGDDQDYAVDRALQQAETRARVNRALEQLPDEFREVIVLREIEELPYKEIAAIAGVPIGTVMSRLSRGRKLLLKSLEAEEA